MVRITVEVGFGDLGEDEDAVLHLREFLDKVYTQNGVQISTGRFGLLFRESIAHQFGNRIGKVLDK